MAKQRGFHLSFQAWCLENEKKELLELYDLAANALGPDEIPFSSPKKQVFRCPVCNESWQISPNKANRTKRGEWNVLLKKKQVTYCKFCKGEVVSKHYSLATEYPEIERYYDAERNAKKTSELFPMAHEKIYIKCNNPACGYQKKDPVRVRDFVRNLAVYRCPKCEGGKNSEITSWNNLAATHPTVAKELLTTEDGRNAGEVLPSFNGYGVFQCPECGHTYRAKITNRTYNSRGCPRKALQKKTSFIEQALCYYLQACNTEVQNRVVDGKTGEEVDILLPQKLVAIECSSRYYHKDVRDRGRDDAKKIKRLSQYYRVYSIQDFDVGKNTPLITYIETPTFLFKKDCLQLFDNLILQLLQELVPGQRSYPNISLENDAITILNQYIFHTVKDNFAEKYPLLATSWHPQKNGNLLPSMFGENFMVPFWWVCKNCGKTYKSLMRNRLQTNPEKCLYCAYGSTKKNGGNTLSECVPGIEMYWHPFLNATLPDAVAPYSEEPCILKLSGQRIVYAKIANLFIWCRSHPDKRLEEYLVYQFEKQHGRGSYMAEP